MTRSKMLLLCTLVVGVFAAVQLAGGVRPSDNSTILEFNSMAPVVPPYTGNTNPIRGVPGAGLPWIIGPTDGELKANGHLEIKVNGLVLAADPSVPAAIQLTNPLPSFRATVSCLSIDSNKLPTTVNVSTNAFQATNQGDSIIETTVSLPSPCFAPIVFVTTPSGAWLAVTGN